MRVSPPVPTNQLAPIIANRVPAVIAAGGERTIYRFIEFFAVLRGGS